MIKGTLLIKKFKSSLSTINDASRTDRHRLLFLLISCFGMLLLKAVGSELRENI